MAKLVAAFFTKSGSMLAEGIHSTADCANQILLLWGVKASQRPADEKHPFGYGRNVSTLINEFEARLRAKCPEAKWVFVEPDLSDETAGMPSSAVARIAG